ncbi:hypothetical protein [Methylorubrum thiocyanatum]|uniref:hypothetical protein n=1 Tax=Methylorubrum thiocyanatum TaxID=47958 RepID=UPI00365C4E1B
MATPPKYVDYRAFDGGTIPGTGIPTGTPSNLANAYVSLNVGDPNSATFNGSTGGYMRVSDLVAYIVALAKES